MIRTSLALLILGSLASMAVAEDNLSMRGEVDAVRQADSLKVVTMIFS